MRTGAGLEQSDLDLSAVASSNGRNDSAGFNFWRSYVGNTLYYEPESLAEKAQTSVLDRGLALVECRGHEL